MICCGALSDHYYIYDPAAEAYGYPITLIHHREKPGNSRERDVIVVQRVRGGLRRIGFVSFLLDQETKLHDFRWPLRNEVRTIPPGPVMLEVVNIDLSRNAYLRNLDLVMLPGTPFGLAWGGLVTSLTRQQRISEAAQVRGELIHVLRDHKTRKQEACALEPVLTL